MAATGGANPFPSTHWSSIYHADHEAEEGRLDPLGDVLARYKPALQAHLVSRWGMQPEQAEDLFQDFFLEKVIREQLIAHASHRRGRFRRYLLTVFERFAINQFRYNRRQARSPDGPVLDISRLQVADHNAASLSEAFDIEWGHQIIDETINLMRVHCEQRGRMDLWGVFVGRVHGPIMRQVRPVPYSQLVEQFGLKSPTQAHMVLASAKRLFREKIREVIGQYSLDDAEIDEEINDLMNCLWSHRA